MRPKTMGRGMGLCAGLAMLAAVGSGQTRRSFPSPGATASSSSGPQQGSRAGVPDDPVFEFRLSPDGTRVAYLTQLSQLASAQVDGAGAPASLHAAEEGTILLTPLLVSADGQRVAFVLQRGFLSGLFSVPMDGSAPALQLDGPALSEQTIFSQTLDASGQTVVYQAEARTRHTVELYAVPLDGSQPPTRLDGPLVAGGNVLEFACSPVGDEVAYSADQRVDGVFELFATRLGGGPSLRLSPDLAAGRDVSHLEIDPRGTRVVFLGDLVRDEQLDLFSVPLDRSLEPVKLSGNLQPRGSVFEFRFSRDGRAVLYRADQERNDAFELYSASLDGHRPEVKLNRPLPGGFVFSFEPVPGGQVLYESDTAGRRELHGVSVDGGPSVLLHAALGTFSLSRFLAPSPDGKSVNFAARTVLGGVLELQRVPIDGRRPPLVLAPGKAALQLQAGSRNDRVAFTELRDEGKTEELFSVRVDGLEPPVPLDPLANLVSGRFELTPDGTRVVYLRNGELRSVALDGSRPSVALGP
jgi:hypothetical protein